MKLLQKMGCVCALMLFAAAANATVVESNYSIDANGTDPGLVIQTADNASNPFTQNVTLGNPVTFDLFDIWTDENSLDNDGFLGLGCGADCDAKPISVNFGFTQPDSGTATVGGTTQGEKVYTLIGIFEKGTLTWNGPADFAFGPLGDGLLRVSLSDEHFNKGYFGLNEGERYGATVQATLDLVSDATAVPEPGTLALLGLGLIGVGVAASRRRHRALRLSV